MYINKECVTVRCDWFYQVTGMVHMEQDHHAQDNSLLSETNVTSGHQVMQVFPEVAVPTRTEKAPRTVPVTFQASPAFNLNAEAAVPAPLSLNLSLSFNLNEQSNSRRSAFTMMPSFSDGDSNSSIIRVA